MRADALLKKEEKRKQERREIKELTSTSRNHDFPFRLLNLSLFLVFKICW